MQKKKDVNEAKKEKEKGYFYAGKEICKKKDVNKIKEKERKKKLLCRKREEFTNKNLNEGGGEKKSLSREKNDT